MFSLPRTAFTPTSRPALVLLALVALLLLAPAPHARAATSGNDAVVYVGQSGAATSEQSLDGVLSTEEQIGFMADRILYTVNQIGTMADRIVYVTELSQDNGMQVTYQVTSLAATGMQDGMYAYEVTLMQVAGLPAGW